MKSFEIRQVEKQSDNKFDSPNLRTVHLTFSAQERTPMLRYSKIDRLTRLPDFQTPISYNGMFKIGARVYFKDGFADDE